MILMDKLESYLPRIVESLKVIDPYKIIIFGSVANGTDKMFSDIDIAVIINKENVPKNYDEKLENKLFVRNAILDLSFEIPIDLLVYTKKEFDRLKNTNKPFFSEITEKGKILYEKAS